MKRTWIILLALAVVQPLAAQESETAPPDSTVRPDSAILRALELPNVAEILRERGVPVEEIEAAIEGARERAIPAGEMTEVMEATAESVEEDGPIENFGAFVQEQLAAGLRGRDLAAAIRAEHARRGIGKGRMLESRRGPPEGRGQGMRGRGMQDSTGTPGMQGRRGGPPDSMRGGPPDSVRGGRPDSMGGPPAKRGGRPDSTGRGNGRGSGGNGGNGGQR
jgi:hypothetical protein